MVKGVPNAVLLAYKSKRLEDESIGDSETGLRQEGLYDRCHGWQKSIALCANKNAQDTDRGETKLNSNEASMRLVDENSVCVDFQSEGESLGFTRIEIRVACD